MIPTEIIQGKTYANFSDLFNNPDNHRILTKKGFKRLLYQLLKLKQFKPLIILQTGKVLGGNMRLRGMDHIMNVMTADELVIYFQENFNTVLGEKEVYELRQAFKKIWISLVIPKDKNEELEIALADNDEAGYYDSTGLSSIMSQYTIAWDNFAASLKEPESLKYLASLGEKTKEDEPPEVPKDAISKLGEVYQLGKHRLMCGDATDMGALTILINNQIIELTQTDPPYGISVVGKDGHIGGGTAKIKVKTYRPVIGDDVELDLKHLLLLAKKTIIWGGNYLAYKLPKGGRWLVWDKDRNEGLSFSDCELAWTNIDGVVVKKYTIRWDGYSREGETKEALHPTMKSTKLMADIIKDYTKENDIVLDVFGGSGSTLIGCEQTNRICYMMELDPRYCDVIRMRYAKFIGKEKEWEKLSPKLKLG